MAQMKNRQTKLTDYEGFVEKFKPKKTTDDCYTPQSFYDCLLTWAREHMPAIAEATEIVRPFWPGGDYEAHDYPEGCVVVDNPPFSILKKIVDTYCRNGIRFLLFAPSLTLFGALRGNDQVTAMVTGVTCTYANGADVNTSFLTNVWPTDARAVILGSLYKILTKENDERIKATKVKLPKLEFPKEVTSAALLQKTVKGGFDFELPRRSTAYISAVGDKQIFGGGVIMSELLTAELRAAELRAAELRAAELRAAELRAAELRAAEPSITIPLTKTELLILEYLNRNEAN